MHNVDSRSYPIRRRSDVQIAAVSVQREDYYPGLDAVDRAALGTVIAELGTNILKYGVQGRIRITWVQEDQRQGLLVEADDQGPGMADVEQAMQEHFSTGRSLGLGLPAVQRMTDELGIVSKPGEGTRVRALRWLRSPPLARQRLQASSPPPPASARRQVEASAKRPSCTLEVAQRVRPCYPEPVSGDQIVVVQHGTFWLVGVVDGCGHGPPAHAVACGVVHRVQERFAELASAHGTSADAAPPARHWLEQLLEAAHQRARGSRGAAIGLSLVDTGRSELWFSGIGNTRIVQFRPRGWTGVSRDGQLGDRFPTPMVQHFPLLPDDMVVQCSDGLRESQLRQLRQNGDQHLSAAGLADLLMSQALRSDDASVVVLRCRP